MGPPLPVGSRDDDARLARVLVMFDVKHEQLEYVLNEDRNGKGSINV